MMLVQENFIPRDISWLSFNERVLQEARDPSVPLVQRLRFLGIFSNNLDEFFKVRVATLRRMADFEKGARKVLGDSPRRILTQIQAEVLRQQEIFQQAYQSILRELANHQIYIVNEQELNRKHSTFVRKYFYEMVLPALVPLMLSPDRPFPVLKDHAIYLALKMSSDRDGAEVQYALIEVPSDVLPRFLILPKVKKNKYIILLEDVIRFCQKDVFVTLNFKRLESFVVKITRDAELNIDNDLSQNLVEKIAKSLNQRKKAAGVRFVYDQEIPTDLLDLLKRGFRFEEDDAMIPGGRIHNFRDFMTFPNIGSKKLLNTLSKPIEHPSLTPDRSLLDVIASGDQLLHLPYHGFSPFIHLLRQAAIDPRVETISLTAYRLARNSKVINALINAAKNSKKVTAFIELQARFDEAANIKWANTLHEEGVNVLVGRTGIKIHCKLLLIERREGAQLRQYAAISTGNFHEGTAAVYSDLILFTSNPNLTSEVEKVFLLLDNLMGSYRFRHLLVSPEHLRKRLTELIRYEAGRARQGQEAWIILKLNSLVDKKMIRELYEASQEGVHIKCIIRGACSLVPGIPGLSDRIEVISIVDKYLEHARIYYFHHGGTEPMFLSSADLMTRNLDHRIEVACPVLDPALKEEIRTMLDLQWKDNTKARILDAARSNQYRPPDGLGVARAQVDFFSFLETQKGKGDNPV